MPHSAPRQPKPLWDRSLRRICYDQRENVEQLSQTVTVQISSASLFVFLNFSNWSLCSKDKNHTDIITAIIFTNGQTWDRVKTLSDRNASDFQRRAPVSGSRLFGEIGDFGDRKTAQPNTENHRNTPKITESSRGRRGQRDWLYRAVTPGAGLAFHRQAQLAIAALVPLLGASGGTLNSYIKGLILGIAVRLLAFSPSRLFAL